MKIKKFKNFEVPAIGQGAGGDNVCADEHRIKVLQYGLDLGMTLIDTAEVYGQGHSEEIVGQAIKGRREKLFISTKFSPEHNHHKDVISSLEGSLRRLNTEYVDLYQIHWPNPSVPIEETMSALMYLKDQGKIRHMGVSNFSMSDLLGAQSVCHDQIESNQVEYNLVERSAEEKMLPYSEEKNIMIMAYTSLWRGHRGKKVLDIMAEKYNKTPVQIILNWLASHKTVVPIPKTLSLEHTKENGLSCDFNLDLNDFHDLSQAFLPVIKEVETGKIRVLPSETDPVYITLKQAMENRFNLQPDVYTLAQDIKMKNILKPVQLIPSSDKTGTYDYDLIQGRMRYWAWILAYGFDKPIKACIKD